MAVFPSCVADSALPLARQKLSGGSSWNNLPLANKEEVAETDPQAEQPGRATCSCESSRAKVSVQSLGPVVPQFLRRRLVLRGRSAAEMAPIEETWTCKACGTGANFGWRAACRKCKAPRAGPKKRGKPKSSSGAGGATGDKKHQQLQQRIDQLEAKLAKAGASGPAGEEEPTAEPEADQAKAEGHRRAVAALQDLGPEYADQVAAHKAALQTIMDRKAAAKPLHLQIRDLDAKIKKQEEAASTLKDVTVPELEEKLAAAKAESAKIDAALEELKTKRAAALQKNGGSTAAIEGQPQTAELTETLREIKQKVGGEDVPLAALLGKAEAKLADLDAALARAKAAAAQATEPRTYAAAASAGLNVDKGATAKVPDDDEMDLDAGALQASFGDILASEAGEAGLNIKAADELKRKLWEAVSTEAAKHRRRKV